MIITMYQIIYVSYNMLYKSFDARKVQKKSKIANNYWCLCDWLNAKIFAFDFYLTFGISTYKLVN